MTLSIRLTSHWHHLRFLLWSFVNFCDVGMIQNFLSRLGELSLLIFAFEHYD